MLDVDTDDLIADHSEILILVVLYRGSASRTCEIHVRVKGCHWYRYSVVSASDMP